MKIKIFSGDNFRKLEDEVNNFIKDKYVLNIQHSSVVTKRTYLIITILYDDTFNCSYVKLPI
ncbi:hypothetical protein [Clostridium sp. 'White wine YQ']|uniref:hypothetical protein n=1 Tax=Clostridium sp. 'White wine YQ' TaxID=3027474 RepID=UPI002366AE22|nr:hypothetical protein [Clostridium sp. 'White wine YQ']MDD7793363.1 hypothetical protein [Clostridium sp. 'White wine YQ']